MVISSGFGFKICGLGFEVFREEVLLKSRKLLAWFFIELKFGIKKCCMAEYCLFCKEFKRLMQ